MSRQTLGVIIGNRDFFPDILVSEARSQIKKVLDKQNINGISLNEKETKLGGVETYSDAQKCADLFRNNRDKIDGILVVLPNFGDEKGVADTIKLANLNVPVLIQAYPDDLNKLGVKRRRDGFCGKISVCNNLHQRNISYSITSTCPVSMSKIYHMQSCQRVAIPCGREGRSISVISDQHAASCVDNHSTVRRI